MTTIPMPDLPEQPLNLVYEPATVRSGPHSTDPSTGPDDAELPTTVVGRVGLGGPVAVPVTVELVRDDPHLAAFVAGEADTAVYRVVHTSLSLHTGPDQPPFESVHVHCQLSNPDGIEEPTAWSVRPLRLADTDTVVTSWQFGPKLNLADLVDIEFGERLRQRTGTAHEVYLEGYGELSSAPGWRINRTDRRPLAGSHRLIMVLRAATGCRTTITVTVRARVRHRHLWWYRADDVDPLLVPATLR